MNRGIEDVPVLVVDKISKRFGGLVAVSEVSFSVRRGEILGLIGPNGAGKTTLFNIIAGLLPPSAGRVVFQGTDVTALPYERRCRLGLARTHQIPRPFRSMTVAENVRVGAVFGHGRARGEIDERVNWALEQVGLGKKASWRASELTGPELKSLEVARALATGPSVLLLDEVVAGLNPAEVVAMTELIRRINGTGVTIVMVEHVMRAVMSVSSRIVMLHHGVKVAEGPPTEVAQNPLVIEAYLGRGAVFDHDNHNERPTHR